MGKSWLKSTVAVDSVGGIKVGEGVSVGRMTVGTGVDVSTAADRIADCVGVFSDGWKGVGVGDGFGADVIKMNGRGVCTTASAGVPHAESKNARSAMVEKAELDFI